MNAIIQKIRERLKEQLPGLDAQLKMAPLKRIPTEPGNEKFKESAVLLLLFPNNNTLNFVLIKRPEETGPHSGQVSFPGGKRDFDDHSLLHTALRETKEEIGTETDSVEILGQLTPLYIAVSQYMVYPYVGYIDKHPDFIPEPGEVEYILEIQLSELLSPSVIKTTLIERKDYSFQTPYFDVKNEIVWGATAMILSEFITILKNNTIDEDILNFNS